MLTKEEVAEIITYCRENNISYKSRIDELGIKEWRFYDAKRRYAQEQEAGSFGEFIELKSSGTYVPAPSFAAKPFSKSPKPDRKMTPVVNIEYTSPDGGVLRIQGALDQSLLKSLILASGGHVQSE